MQSQDSIDKFQRLLWPELANVLRVARILCGDPVEAEDLAQETMLRRTGLSIDSRVRMPGRGS